MDSGEVGRKRGSLVSDLSSTVNSVERTVKPELTTKIAQPIRVVMVAACPFPANHGTPGAIRELAIHLQSQGLEVHVVTYPQSEDISVEGLHVHRVRVPFIKARPVSIGPSFERIIFDVFLVPRLIGVIRRHKIEVIHAHNYEANIAGAIAKWVTRRPLIYNGVTSMADELPSYRHMPQKITRFVGKMLDWIVPRFSDVIMVLSDELKDYLVKMGNPADKILVVPPGVEMEWLDSGNGKRVYKELGIDDHVPLVLYTGALETFQRIDYLLQAMALVCKENAQSILVIAANVKNAQALEQHQAMAITLGIADRVRFVESVPLGELPNYLAAAAVAVVPRPSCPGYPIKLLNYMAAGIPIVSFSGSAKSLVHGYSGYVAADHDVEDLASGISLLLNDQSVAEKLGFRAQRSLDGVFDWQTIAGGVAEVYSQLIRRQDKLSRKSLANYLKSSYTPALKDRIEVSEFVVDGTLVYPVFSENS